MTRRSCAIYATGIVCAHLLIVGIALLVAQVFQTMIHSRLKQVRHLLNEHLERFPMSSPFSLCLSTTLKHSPVWFHLQWLAAHQSVAGAAPAGVCSWCFYCYRQVLEFKSMHCLFFAAFVTVIIGFPLFG